MSYPNQRIIHINKRKYTAGFLQIGIQEWQEARKQLNYSEFTLYLYLAGNADGYNLELSQQAIEQATGIKKTSYHSAVNKLIALGYLNLKKGNIYYFFTSPVRPSGQAQPTQKTKTEPPCPPPQTGFSAQQNKQVHSTNIEIDKTDKINIIDKESPRERNGERNSLTFDDYSRDECERDTQVYLSVFSMVDKKKIIECIQSKEAQGKDSRWINYAIADIAPLTWLKQGFGLLDDSDYIAQVDAKWQTNKSAPFVPWEKRFFAEEDEALEEVEG